MPDFVPPSLLPNATPDNPVLRLAQSRHALVRHMNGEPSARSADQQRSAGEHAADSDGTGDLDGNSIFSTVSHALSMWWRHHPYNAAVDLARPVVQGYARQHPVKLLGIAAAAGAAVVIIKPWRLVSIGGLLLATVKSSGLSSVVMSLVSRRPSHTPSSTDTPLHDPL
ncbi:hypothetical protein [Polaromonas sp. YR568]|uniref:hypothetical protein n=1 Tax=Polaromonas sp. YR568 TaxID=1855301 RepID=UPI003137BE1D